MKSSPILAANQRVERITVTTLVVGIDIAKDEHTAQVATWRGVIITKRAIQFANNESGFEHLLRSIERLKQEHQMGDVIVGMESTGHYFFNLANWLTDKGIEVVVVNPATTKRNKENRDNTPSKSDPKDAAVIAEAVSRGFYTPYRRKDPLFHRLSILVKTRERLIHDSMRTMNQIHGWLDVYFPEYPSVFRDVFCPRSLATLHKIPTPSDLRGLSPEDVVEKWAESRMSRPGGRRGLMKAVALLKVAQNSVGTNEGLAEAKWELELLLEDYTRLQKQVTEVENMIEKLLQDIPQVNILRTAGLTANTCAAILACAGDLSQFDHGNQLLRLAGLNLAEKTSGKYKGQIKLSKRGNSTLRKYLYLAVFHLIGNHPDFKALHEHNVAIKQMKPMQSMMKLIGKLARILVAMARKNESFCKEIAMQSVA